MEAGDAGRVGTRCGGRAEETAAPTSAREKVCRGGEGVGAAVAGVGAKAELGVADEGTDADDEDDVGT